MARRGTTAGRHRSGGRATAARSARVRGVRRDEAVLRRPQRGPVGQRLRVRDVQRRPGDRSVLQCGGRRHRRRPAVEQPYVPINCGTRREVRRVAAHCDRPGIPGRSQASPSVRSGSVPRSLGRAILALERLGDDGTVDDGAGGAQAAHEVVHLTGECAEVVPSTGGARRLCAAGRAGRSTAAGGRATGAGSGRQLAGSPPATPIRGRTPGFAGVQPDDPPRTAASRVAATARPSRPVNGRPAVKGAGTTHLRVPRSSGDIQLRCTRRSYGPSP